MLMYEYLYQYIHLYLLMYIVYSYLSILLHLFTFFVKYNRWSLLLFFHISNHSLIRKKNCIIKEMVITISRKFQLFYYFIVVDTYIFFSLNFSLFFFFPRIHFHIIIFHSFYYYYFE